MGFNSGFKGLNSVIILGKMSTEDIVWRLGKVMVVTSSLADEGKEQFTLRRMFLVTDKLKT